MSSPRFKRDRAAVSSVPKLFGVKTVEADTLTLPMGLQGPT